MSRISKQKRNQLILVALVTLLVVAGLWFSLIRYQQDNLVSLAAKTQKSRITFSQIQDTIKNSREIEASLNALSNRLAEQEGDMASGDLYKSMINIIKSFKAPYRVDIPEFHSGGDAVPVNLLPKFPYKQVTLGISGTAYYYDLGRFVADFENQFPSSRISNLELVPASASGPEEKLSFRMDIISLVKPGVARPAITP